MLFISLKKLIQQHIYYIHELFSPLVAKLFFLVLDRYNLN